MWDPLARCRRICYIENELREVRAAGDMGGILFEQRRTTIVEDANTLNHASSSCLPTVLQAELFSFLGLHVLQECLGTASSLFPSPRFRKGVQAPLSKGN
jgi:hypothetical protein